ncbi:MAG: carbamoyltransferase [Verrucomicrobiota bacterium]
MSGYTLGISSFYHDSAAALVKDGEVLAAAQEERFSRIKHDSAFPQQATKYCLDEHDISLADCEHIVFYDKPFLKFERLMETYAALAPSGFKSFRMALPLWVKEKLFLKSLLVEELEQFGDKDDIRSKLLFTEHHISHAASAFYPSPFKEAAILVMDGVGEWATTTLSLGSDREIHNLKEIYFPHSLGLLYSAFTYYTGFRVNSGEYKLMGLAPYGKPKYVDLIKEHLIEVKQDGSFRLNMKYFNYPTGLTMTNERFADLFGGPAREGESRITQREMDLAASIQVVLEEVVIKLARSISEETGQKNLCLAGGVALNCVANGRLLEEGLFDQIWVQPASGDAGGALGAALYANHFYQGRERNIQSDGMDQMKGAYLGPSFKDEEISECLNQCGAKWERLDRDELLKRVSEDLATELAVGWFQGKMEFGPRALGGRSILGDPRSPKMQSALNLKVKFRESFRPFAPAVLAEDVSDWFEMNEHSPYMLMVASVRSEKCRKMSEADEALFGIDKLNISRSEIPAVTHVDYSARVQTVHRETNSMFYDLISRFKEITGVPVLINTSFNVRGEPIVGSPEDAFRCFMGTDLDVLVVGSCYLKKEDQSEDLKKHYHESFELD